MTSRSTTSRDQHRATIKRTRPACAICGHDIDYSLHYLDPGAFVIDHIVPLVRGGADTIDNIQAAHRSCNRSKSDKVDGQPPATLRRVRTY